MDGELWMSRKRIPCNERFEFSGKERDEETGYDYFGRRNYTSAASIWLSIDPLLDNWDYFNIINTQINTL
jgi:RHS repeat-associated protein